jgi:hypothetical protein
MRNDAGDVETHIVLGIGVSLGANSTHDFGDMKITQETATAGGSLENANGFRGRDLEALSPKNNGRGRVRRIENRITGGAEFADKKIGGALVETEKNMDFRETTSGNSVGERSLRESTALGIGRRK